MDAVLSFLKLTHTDFVMILVTVPLFVLFWQLMARFVFRPYIALFEQREAATSGAEDSARVQQQEAETILSEYESRITATRVTAMQQKLARLKDAATQAASVVGAAEQEGRDYLSKGRQELQRSSETLRSDLKKSSDQMVEDIVRRLKEPQRSAQAN